MTVHKVSSWHNKTPHATMRDQMNSVCVCGLWVKQILWALLYTMDIMNEVMTQYDMYVLAIYARAA